MWGLKKRPHERRVRVLNRLGLTADDHGRGAELQDLHELVLHRGKHLRPSLERHEPAVVPTPRAVIPTAVEAGYRLRLLVQKDDLAKVGALFTSNVLEGIDLVWTSQVLRKDHGPPSCKVSRRHRQGDRTQDVVRAVVHVLPATDQPVQAVDIQVEGAGMSFHVESGERGLPDPRRAVQVDEGGHWTWRHGRSISCFVGVTAWRPGSCAFDVDAMMRLWSEQLPDAPAEFRELYDARWGFSLVA